MLSKFECNRVKPFFQEEAGPRRKRKMCSDLLACYSYQGFKKGTSADGKECTVAEKEIEGQTLQDENAKVKLTQPFVFHAHT